MTKHPHLKGMWPDWKLHKIPFHVQHCPHPTVDFGSYRWAWDRAVRIILEISSFPFLTGRAFDFVMLLWGQVRGPPRNSGLGECYFSALLSSCHSVFLLLSCGSHLPRWSSPLPLPVLIAPAVGWWSFRIWLCPAVTEAAFHCLYFRVIWKVLFWDWREKFEIFESGGKWLSDKSKINPQLCNG